ncbi:MAG: glycoside hydrolase [Clostridia bacterium]|nr:glycoside hydrolase [Clostridia bacterium]
MRNICVSINDEKGKVDRFFARCISAGRAGELMRFPVMEQLERARRECGFEYIRFHGLFHEEMNVVRRNAASKPEFSFAYIDMLFDKLLSIGIRPVCELGLMPRDMASEEKYVFWWKMNVSMPRDMAEWGALVAAFVRHVTNRYGEDEVKKWYFEVWNEPNHPHFFTEYKNKEAYFALYDAAALAVKGVNAEYRVGGPASAGMAWIDDIIEHCRENGVPIDFITSHSYGARGDFDPDGNAVIIIRELDKVANEVRANGEKCKNNGLPLVVTEWSPSYSSTDTVHDHYFCAAYLLNTLKKCEGYAEMMSYWVISDIFEEVAPPTSPFHGGFGLINMQGVPKPVYHAYTFLAALGETELACGDESAYAAKSARGAQVLAWNTALPCKVESRKYFAGEIANGEAESIAVSIGGLEAGKTYTVCRKTLGKGKGDPWLEYKSGKYGTLEKLHEAEALAAASKPVEERFSATADESGTLRFTLEQRENQVDLAEIEF